MRLEILQTIMLDFATNPCKSWGDLENGEQFLDGHQASVTIEQSDRNTARLLSGTYTHDQLDDFDHQLAAVETNGYGTARFNSYMPDSLEFLHTCVKCEKPFASCLADADTCYHCHL